MNHKIKNTSILIIPQWATKSALDKNFNAKASSINPKETLIVFNHPPDYGNDSSIFGNIANNANGSPSASPNPPIPTVNSQAAESLEIDPASSDPNIGPVQEKDTIANVRAIKNIPIIPPADSLLADLSTQDEGSDNS